MTDVVNLPAELDAISDHWSPRVVAAVNDYELKVVKVLGTFVAHAHPETDELFMVRTGRLVLRMDDGDVELGPGDVYVVPRGVRHQPVADTETELLLLEPRGTPNTGDAAR